MAGSYIDFSKGSGREDVLSESDIDILQKLGKLNDRGTLVYSIEFLTSQTYKTRSASSELISAVGLKLVNLINSGFVFTEEGVEGNEPVLYFGISTKAERYLRECGIYSDTPCRRKPDMIGDILFAQEERHTADKTLIYRPCNELDGFDGKICLGIGEEEFCVGCVKEGSGKKLMVPSHSAMYAEIANIPEKKNTSGANFYPLFAELLEEFLLMDKPMASKTAVHIRSKKSGVSRLLVTKDYDLTSHGKSYYSVVKQAFSGEAITPEDADSGEIEIIPDISAYEKCMEKIHNTFEVAVKHNDSVEVVF